jgi:Papain family cysteine protease
MEAADMAKTVAPGAIDIPHIDTFTANALPDPFDERDLEYRPRLQPLPPELDQRTGVSRRYVMRQAGSSCTGHALAAVINTVLSHGAGDGARGRPAQTPHVSPYMLYHLARRYDEFAGEDDAGSSLRGALKGWFNHGVLPEARWPSLDIDPVPDLDDEELLELARRWPLGTFYRVNPLRLDDMQSAITELHAICASAVVHDGWAQPQIMRRNGQVLHVIARRVDAKQLGGHAFALVGYNEVGFLVQNSWGTDWGKGGFATLPYEDWLDSAYDAWVTRPGVPKTPFASGRTRTAAATGGELVTAPAPDLKRLANHVVNLGNQGLLSTSGSFVSTPAQVDRAFGHMQRWHDQWLARDGAPRERHVLLYAHGGLNAEDQGLRSAQRNVNWWLNNRIYPLFFAWQSGPAETLVDQLADTVRVRLPFGLGFDFMEAFDRAVELLARRSFRWMWNEMKENARAASKPIANMGDAAWPPTPTSQTAMARMPGASLTVLRLAEYVRQHPDERVLVHLVGHSAGAIFHAALLQRLVEAGVPVASMALLAPALRVDEFERDILPHLGANGGVRRFTVFNLSDRRELDDACAAGGVDVYHKSLLYLVSRALEQRPDGQSEAPLLGMARFFDRPPGGTLRRRIEARGGACVFSPAALANDSRSDATSHGGFAGDAQTMTSVVLRALGRSTPAPENGYQPNAALIETEPTPAAARPRQPEAAPSMVAAETHEPGEQPLAETAEPQTEQPTAPDEPARLDPEVAVAPHSGSPVIDLLQAQGWRMENPHSNRTPRPRSLAARGWQRWRGLLDLLRGYRRAT